MDTTTTVLVGLALIAIAIIFIISPWKPQAQLDLTSREEKDDLVDPTHKCPVVADEVKEAVTKRRATRKKVVDTNAVPEKQQVVAKKTKRVKQI